MCSRKPSISTISTASASRGKPTGAPRFDGFDCRSVHHFQRRGNDPGGGDFNDGLGGVIHPIEDRQKRAHRLASAHESDDDFGDDAHGSFRADEHAAEIVAGRVRNFAAEPDNLTVVQYHFDAKHVIGRDAVGERMRPAGIVGDVAADRACGLAARIGRVKKAVFGDCFGDIER